MWRRGGASNAAAARKSEIGIVIGRDIRADADPGCTAQHRRSGRSRRCLAGALGDEASSNSS